MPLRSLIHLPFIHGERVVFEFRPDPLHGILSQDTSVWLVQVQMEGGPGRRPALAPPPLGPGL